MARPPIVGAWTDPAPPEPIVPFGTVLTRLLIAGGIDGVTALLSIIADVEAAPGEPTPTERLLAAMEGIAPDDASAHTLLSAAGFDPAIILRMGD